MSSLQNSVKRKTHKERAQPAARQQYGLLEKKKDYQLRAKDYHRKEKALQELWRKAEDRNPDEFYFAMEHRRTKAGVDVGRSEANRHSSNELKAMKDFDINFVQQRLQTEKRRTERLRNSLHFLGCATPSNHTVFVDDEQSVRQLSREQHFGTPAELLDRCYNRPTTEQLSAGVATSASEPAERTATRAKRRQAAVYREVSEHTQRTEQLRELADRLALQRLVMGKGRKTKTKQGFRWKKERNK